MAEKHTLNLTWPFAVWTVVFLLVAWLTGWPTPLLIVALLPWLLVLAFSIFVFGLVLILWYRVTHGYVNPRLSVKWRGKEKNPHHRNYQP